MTSVQSSGHQQIREQSKSLEHGRERGLYLYVYLYRTGAVLKTSHRRAIVMRLVEPDIGRRHECGDGRARQRYRLGSRP